jgi:hypothetical protein
MVLAYFGPAFMIGHYDISSAQEYSSSFIELTFSGVQNSEIVPYNMLTWLKKSTTIISLGAFSRAMEADHVLQSTHSDLLPREAEPPFSNYPTPINQLFTIYGDNCSYQSLLSILLELPLLGSFNCLLWSERCGSAWLTVRRAELRRTSGLIVFAVAR